MPWFGVAVAVGARSGLDAGGRCSAAELSHELLVLGVVFSASADPSGGPGTLITPACTSLSIRTVASHVAGVATHSADDAGSEVLLLGAVVLAVSYLATVLASLVFIVTQSSVQSSELSELVTLQFVLALGDGSSGFDDVVDQFLGLVNLVLGVGHDQAVEILFLITGVSCIGAALALLDGTLATNGNFCTRFGLHLLQSVATRADE